MSSERLSAEHYRSLFGAVDRPMLTFDFDSALALESNDAARELFGYGETELQRMKGRDFHGSVVDVPEVSRSLHEQRFFGGRLRMRRKDGSLFWADVSIQVFESEGSLRGVDTFRDVTAEVEREAAIQRERDELLEENARMAEQLRALTDRNRELRRYSTRVAHDLRAPLGHIAGYSSLLLDARRRGLGERGTRQALGGIERSATRMATTVKSLLELAEAERDAKPPDVVDLEQLVCEALSAHERAARDHGVSITYRVDAEPIVAHEGCLFVMLQNLIDNAIKYRSTQRPAELTIEVEQSERETRLRVLDNGVGLDTTESERLTQFFARSTGAMLADGLGIGLSTVKRVVDLHGGQLAMRPGDPGTRVEVRLPR